MSGWGGWISKSPAGRSYCFLLLRTGNLRLVRYWSNALLYICGQFRTIQLFNLFVGQIFLDNCERLCSKVRLTFCGIESAELTICVSRFFRTAHLTAAFLVFERQRPRRPIMHNNHTHRSCNIHLADSLLIQTFHILDTHLWDAVFHAWDT